MVVPSKDVQGMSDRAPARVTIASNQEANQEGEFRFVGERVADVSGDWRTSR